MKIKVFLPCHTDYERLDFALSNFTKYNPRIEIFSIAVNGANPEEVYKKYNIKKFKKVKENMLQYFTNSAGATERVIGYPIVQYLFEYALNETEYDYILHLETDVFCKKPITHAPIYDLSGPVGQSSVYNNQEAQRIYELDKYNMLKNGPFWLQTGCGASIFSKKYFLNSYANLSKIKYFSEKYPSISHGDMSFTILAAISKCTYGPWDDATQKNAILPYNENASLEHNVKI
jgi:hypothetical protein